MRIISILAMAGILAAGAVAPCAAKLGETPEFIEARYGRPIDIETEPPLPVRTYRFQGFRITVKYLNGVSVSETIESEEQNQRLGDETCLTLARALTGKTNWTTEPAQNPAVTRWISPPEFQAEKFNPGGGDELEVCNLAYVNEMSKVTAAKNKALAAAFGSDVSTNLAKSGGKGTNAPTRAEAEREKAKKETEAKVLKFHQELAESGDPYGQYKMGLRYLKGDGVEKDEQKARELLRKSAAQGFQQAADALAKLPEQK